MVKRLHRAIVNALKLADTPDGWKRIAQPENMRAGIGRSARELSLVSILNRQIADAQAREKRIVDEGERVAQQRLIAELRKHLNVELSTEPCGLAA
ncbi:hypothetical protein [Shimia abyssi]|uniref:Uncharacterized protein n=1 Tax=Shimia abyssi TaxID=1662395 RepID=A0A2P8FHT6_9RHOB|nr:hypothetical protein [Shimia abyssi]PSL21268.1 hypothetical protein CLV88_102388 [Shimia abyssi]